MIGIWPAHQRTGQNCLTGKPEFVITEETGKMIKKWCETGVDVPELDHSWLEGVENCKSQKELVSYYNTHKKDIDANPKLQKVMSDRRAAIQSAQSQTA
jgi:hypothetical protein